ncbi:hypothetical protein EJ04DRAFT_508083 [Polyplosphaeria fusca]|uniref:Uncharacterized protein n=1 Tax=Polyplosphaeria fusca TaxID=682080 RepID=A0A9P4R8J5_9PLEO|nr:hypothetical protein EJ04DRAFT_508083 [Polyplosphaeria fusca]
MLFHALLATFAISFAFASPQPTATPAPAPDALYHLEKRACNADNCLRALQNRASSAIPFCSTYTTSATATIPTWATSQCANNPTRVTSACNCLATEPLKKVYGPTDNTNYTVYSQAHNINSRPAASWQEYFDQCYQMCVWYGSECQTFSYAEMSGPNGTPGSGNYLCYIYETPFQPELVANAPGWRRNVVYTRL